MKKKLKVLYIAHGHPAIRPGGAEIYSMELYQAMRASPDVEPILLARSGPPISITKQPHEGTLIAKVGPDPNQYFFYTDADNFDFFYMTARHKMVHLRNFRAFLEAHQPDVVHFQHALFLGYDLIRETRNTLPNAPIIFTLHEFLPICQRQGQMIRTIDNELCLEESPRRCHECFPEISPPSFFMRKRFVQSHFSLVDVFLAPSNFLIERFVDWGLPRERIKYEDYGRRDFAIGVETEGRRRNRLGFFGQFNLFKGVTVLLEAVRLLEAEGRCDVDIRLHGANLDLQPEPFQDEFRALLAATKSKVTLVGRYGSAELTGLMDGVDWVVVPSIWWENSPLVIQEAFAHRRPVICSDIGGMAEKVTHGVNGLHFRVGDPASLAQTIQTAVSSPGLWEALRSAISSPYRIDDSVQALTAIYRTLLEGKAACA